MDFGIRGSSVGEFHGGDSERPDVSLEIVTILLDDLWRHPKGSADKGHPLRFDVGELGGDTEISELDSARLGKEDVGSLDITMDLSSGVEVIEAEEKFAADDGNVCLVEGTGTQLYRGKG